MGRGTPHFEPVRADRFIAFLYGAVIIGAILVLLLGGCSSSRLTEATVPAQESSVQPPSLTDTVTVEQMAPVPPPGTPTAPIEIAMYDTARAGQEVSRITLTDQTLDVLLPSGKMLSFSDVAAGETIDVRTAPDTVKAEVRGEPKEQKIMAECPPCPEGWWGMKGEFAVLGALFAGGLVVGVVLKIVGTSILPI